MLASVPILAGTRMSPIEHNAGCMCLWVFFIKLRKFPLLPAYWKHLFRRAVAFCQMPFVDLIPWSPIFVLFSFFFFLIWSVDVIDYTDFPYHSFRAEGWTQILFIPGKALSSWSMSPTSLNFQAKFPLYTINKQIWEPVQSCSST